MPSRQMSAVEDLRRMLQDAFTKGLRPTNAWVDAKVLQGLQKIAKRYEGPGKPPDPVSIREAVKHFRWTGQPDGWRGLKRVCYGAGMVLEDGWCLLADNKLMQELRRLAQDQANPRRRIKCFQALLASYWSFPLFESDEKAREGWKELRRWLAEQMSEVERDLDTLQKSPRWFETLREHRNLLSDNPCRRYGPQLLAGNSAELQAAIEGLGIPRGSWVEEEAVIAQVRSACSHKDQGFQDLLPRMLRIATGQSDLKISKMTQIKSVALLVSRYAKIPGRLEHAALRDAAVHIIGNPWLHRPAWNANVVDESGSPDENARQMVLGWLKRRLITDFFELLSNDRSGDSRRLAYWLRFEPFISDMWFALGSSAQWRRDEPFEDFRKRSQWRRLDLVEAPADNNAFLMRIGNYLVVEFSQTGNACYLYRWDRLPPAVSRILADKGSGSVTLKQLKVDHHELKKIHMDSRKNMKSWEQKFDGEICPMLGIRPDQRPAFVPELEALLQEHTVDGEDKRPLGGALWVYGDDRDSRLNQKLHELGFSYRPLKGWYRE